MANPYEMLFGGPSAFDYFLKGQSAQQQFNANQQLEQQRLQQMAAADQAYKQQALLNPIAVDEALAGVRNANLTGDINQGTRDYNQATQQNRIDLSDQSVISGQQGIDESTAQSQRLAAMAPLQRNSERALEAQRQAAAYKSMQGANKIQAGNQGQMALGLGGMAQNILETAQQNPEKAQQMLNNAGAAFKAQYKQDLPQDFNSMEGLQNYAAMGSNLQANMSATDPKAAKDIQAVRMNESEAVSKKEKDIRDRTSKAKNIYAATSEGLKLVDRLIGEGSEYSKGNMFSDWNRATGPLQSKALTLDQDVVNLEEDVKALGSVLTMANIDKMTGVLSESDLKVLRDSAANLELRQGPERLKDILLNVDRVLEKTNKLASEKYGVKEEIPDTPNAQISNDELQTYIQKYRTPGLGRRGPSGGQ